MDPKVLEVRSVSKSIKRRKLLHNLSFDIEQGDICGFLGPNGAGKTTLIRMIMGLVKPSEGDILVLGHSVTKNRNQALKRVGAIVETPVFFGHMTGRGNLKNLIKLHPNIPVIGCTTSIAMLFAALGDWQLLNPYFFSLVVTDLTNYRQSSIYAGTASISIIGVLALLSALYLYKNNDITNN